VYIFKTTQLLGIWMAT